MKEWVLILVVSVSSGEGVKKIAISSHSTPSECQAAADVGVPGIEAIGYYCITRSEMDRVNAKAQRTCREWWSSYRKYMNSKWFFQPAIKEPGCRLKESNK